MIYETPSGCVLVIAADARSVEFWRPGAEEAFTFTAPPEMTDQDARMAIAAALMATKNLGQA